jgi:Fe-S-cluster containining protein
MVTQNPKDLPDPVAVSNTDKYFLLRDEIDALCHKLSETHKDQIVCSPGCSHCCMDFSIFPVEFYSILKETGGLKPNINNNVTENECVFLIKGLCSIYKSRPIICRTHGLPLLYMNDEEWQLSHCELNFTGSKVPEFDETNCFPQDRFNSRLFLINRDFIKSSGMMQYSDNDLIPLREIRDNTLA